MELFNELGSKVKIHTTRITVEDVTYEEANQVAQLVNWRQYHVNKLGNDKMDVSFIASTEETKRIWDYLKGDAPDPMLA